MTKKEIELQCEIAYQKKFLELTGLKIGDKVRCRFTTHHGDSKHSYMSSVEGDGEIVETDKGIFIRSFEKYPKAHEEKRYPYRLNSPTYWAYSNEEQLSKLDYIILENNNQ